MPVIGGIDVPDVEPQALPPRAQTRSERPDYSDILEAGIERAKGEVRYGLPLAFRQARGDITAPEYNEYARNLARTAQRAQEINPQGVANIEDVFAGRAGVLDFIGENLVASVPRTGSTIAGSAAGALVGGLPGAAVGSVLVGAPQFAGSNTARAVEEGPLTREGATRSLLAAPAQAGADALLGRFLPGAGKVLGKGAATQSGGLAKRVVSGAMKAGATEAVTEVGQQVGERWAAGLPLGNAEAMREYVHAAAAAFAVGGTLGGAGGLTRGRPAADAKPAQDVTPEDTIEKIDNIIDPTGSLGLNQNVQGELPLVGGAGVEQQRELPLAPGVAPSAGPGDFQQNLPFNPLSEVAPGEQLELGVPYSDNLTPVDLAEGQAIPDVRPSEQLALPGAEPRLALPVPTDFTVDTQGNIIPNRPLINEPIADLKSALKSKNIQPAQAEAINAEITAREREAAGVTETSGKEFQERVLPQLKQGLRGGLVQEADAQSLTALRVKVHEALVEKLDKDALKKNELEFGKRLGLLTDDGRFTDLAAEIALAKENPDFVSSTDKRITEAEAREALTPQERETPRFEAGAVDPAFQQEWAKALTEKATPEVQALAPRNAQEAAAQLYTELGRRDIGDTTYTQIEALAKNQGLLDKSGNLTRKAREVATQVDPGVQEDIAAAADALGYVGTNAEAFRAAAQGATEPPAVANRYAHEAGAEWRRRFVERSDTATAQQTRQFTNEQLAAEDQTGAASRTQYIRNVDIQPEQLRTAALNNMIDAANLEGVQDSEVATLRRMARDPNVEPVEVEEALKQVSGGQPLFLQPAATQTQRAETEARAAASGRPEVSFRGLQRQRAQALAAARQREAAKVSKADQRAETEVAVEKYDLRQGLRRAFDLKDISRAEFIRGTNTLNKATTDEDLKPVQALLEERTRAVFSSLFSQTDVQLEAAVTGKSYAEVLDHMVSSAATAVDREIAQSIRQIAKVMESVGIEYEFRVVQEGDTVPERFNDPGVHALSTFQVNPSKATIWLRSASNGGVINREIIMHELLHSVTEAPLQLGIEPGALGTRMGTAVRDLYDLSTALSQHLDARARAGTLTDFEQKLRAQQINALENPAEILSWGLTNPEMQRYLASVEYKPKQSFLNRLVQLVRQYLGLDARHDTALTELFRVADQILTTDQAELESHVARENPDMAPSVAAVRAAADSTIADASDRTREWLTQAATAADRHNIPWREMTEKFRQGALGWMSANQLVRQYGRYIPGLDGWVRANDKRAATRGKYEQLGDGVQQRFDKVQQADKKGKEVADKIEDLMNATVYGIDPRKSWAQHEHLHIQDRAEATPRQLRRETRLQEMVREANTKLNDVRRAGHLDVYEDLVRLNEMSRYSELATDMYALVARDPEYAKGLGLSDPTNKFLRQEGLDSARSARDFWRQELFQQIAAADNYIDTSRAASLNAKPSEIAALESRLTPLEGQLKAVRETLAGMERAPYFHLGRFGDHFVSFRIGKTDDGFMDEAKADKVAQALESAGFTGAQISTDNKNPNVYIRLDNKDQRERLFQLAHDLAEEGLLDPNKDITQGLRTDEENMGVSSNLDKHVEEYIRRLKESSVYQTDDEMTAKQKREIKKNLDSAIAAARDAFIALQPQQAISRVLVHRENVQGHANDMMRGFAHRYRIHSVSAANKAVSVDLSDAHDSMRKTVKEAQKRKPSEDGPSVDLLQNLSREVRLREVLHPDTAFADAFDRARAVSNAFYLGMSPAYALLNISQLGVTVWPEIGAKFGFRNGFTALRKGSTDAGKVMAAVFKEAQKVGLQKIADVAITEDVIRKSGVSTETAKFINRMIASGTIDIGAAARELARVSGETTWTKTNEALRLASTLGLYSETYSRLAAALAAREAHGGTLEASEAYAIRVVKDNMFDYKQANTARNLGRAGVLGKATPIVTQFMQYSVQLMEKFYSETYNWVGQKRPGETDAELKERKRVARRWLAGHAMMVTFLAGSLGLPFAAIGARVVESLVDSFDDDDEPFNFSAAYKNWLTDIVGPTAANVIASGAPRAAGFDLSQRAGEQDLLPFTEFFVDRRDWKDAYESFLTSKTGAVPSMISSVIEGGGKMADGKFLEGMITASPIFLRNIGKTYQMKAEGYVDSDGDPLPITPKAQEYLWQILGFTPSTKALYSEARRDQQIRRGVLGRRASDIRNRIFQAIENGDREAAAAALEEAREFDASQTNSQILPNLRSAFRRRLQAREEARALETPLGVRPKDLDALRLTRYASEAYR